MQNAYEMAVDALGLALTSRKQEHQEIPVPSQPKDITVSENEYCIIIEFDMLAYQKRNNSKAVKKTLTIPEWLNEAAIRENLNFSQILQESSLCSLSQDSRYLPHPLLPGSGGGEALFR